MVAPYRAPARAAIVDDDGTPRTRDRFVAAWAELRRVRRLRRRLVAAYLVNAIVVVTAIAYGAPVPILLPFVIFVHPLFFVEAVTLGEFDCPRCRKKFEVGMLRHPLTRQCVHCATPIDSPSPPPTLPPILAAACSPPPATQRPLLLQPDPRRPPC